MSYPESESAAMRERWIEIEEEGGALVHARRWPCRFDLAVTVRFAVEEGQGLSRRRLARAVRQDMWRALQKLRGFAPAVRVTPVAGGVEVVAGGQVEPRWPRALTEAQLSEVLTDPARQARWLTWAAAMVLALLPQVSDAQESIEGAPSGLAMTLYEFLLEPQDTGAVWARFRLVAPDLGQGADFARVEPDFPWFCETQALPRLKAAAAEADVAVISLSSELIPFGDIAPEIVQFFEAFRLEGDRCIWEVF